MTARRGGGGGDNGDGQGHGGDRSGGVMKSDRELATGDWRLELLEDPLNNRTPLACTCFGGIYIKYRWFVFVSASHILNTAGYHCVFCRCHCCVG